MVNTLEIQNILSKDSSNVTDLLFQNEWSPTTKQVNTLNWSNYFSPPTSAWGNHLSKPKEQTKFELDVQNAIEISQKIDAFQPNIEVGTKVENLDAINWNSEARFCDIRPRLFDKSANTFRLIDTGSQISTTKKLPGDEPDPNYRLKAVNNSSIQTYGFREITVKINRKAYKVKAVIVDLNQEILGMDFLNSYKLGLDWIDETLHIFDKKAQIKAPLQFVTVPSDMMRTQSIEAVEEEAGFQVNPDVADPAWVEFQVACMKSLTSSDAFTNQNKSENDYTNVHETSSEKQKRGKIQKQLPEIQRLLEKYPGLLSETFDPNPKHGLFHKIETGNNTPCRAKRRPETTNRTKNELGKKAWNKMLKDGIISPVSASSNTDWTSNLTIANKPGGGVRCCSDFRQLNLKTLTLDAYPLPLLKNFTEKIHGCTVFSKLDLKSSFWNIPIHPDCRHKTTTLSPWGGAYVYNRLPFGLKSGPSNMQRLLEVTLSGIENCFLYIDDILLFSKSKEEHMRTIEEIFKRLSENKMPLSIDKCEFIKDSVEYLGYTVNSTGIRPLKRKLQALEEFQPPKNQKEMLHFLGAINYFRSSLKGMRINGKCQYGRYIATALQCRNNTTRENKI